MPTKNKAPNKPQPLTARELKVLEYIEQYVQHQSIAPSYQEIKDHFGFASFNSVQRYLKQLQDKNYIHMPGDNQKRAIQVRHSSKTISNSLETQNRSGFAVQTTHYPSLTQTKKETLTGSPPVESLSLPLLGRVAAGAPIEAFTHNEFVDAPATLVRHPGKTFGLIVQGQSMIDDGILDGDIIFVQKQSYANNGETIVATVENQATVKRFYIHSNPQSKAHSQIELRPANQSMSSMWFDPDEVSIQGIVVGLIRRF